MIQILQQSTSFLETTSQSNSGKIYAYHNNSWFYFRSAYSRSNRDQKNDFGFQSNSGQKRHPFLHPSLPVSASINSGSTSTTQTDVGDRAMKANLVKIAHLLAAHVQPILYRLYIVKYSGF